MAPVILSNKLSSSKTQLWILGVLIFALNLIVIIQISNYHDNFEVQQFQMHVHVQPCVVKGKNNLVRNYKDAVIKRKVEDDVIEVDECQGMTMAIVMRAIGSVVNEEMRQHPPYSLVSREGFICDLNDSFSYPRKNKKQRIEVEDNGGLIIMTFVINLSLHKDAEAVCTDKNGGEVDLNGSDGADNFVIHHIADQNAVPGADAAMEVEILVEITNQVLEENADTDQEMLLVLLTPRPKLFWRWTSGLMN